MIYEQFLSMLRSINEEYQPIENEAYEIFEFVDKANRVQEQLVALQNKTAGLINAVKDAPDLDDNTKEEYWREVDNLNQRILNIEGHINNIVNSLERTGSFVHLVRICHMLK